MPYIHEHPNWPRLIWRAADLMTPLAEVRHRQGRLLERMQMMGFDAQTEASVATLTNDVVKSSAIEGEILNPDEVRSSIARQLGLDAGGLPATGRDVDGIVEITLDATQRYDQILTEERLFGWHAALFPTGRSGIKKIKVGAWRTKDAGPMEVVSGTYGRERVHFVAPDAERLQEEMNRFLRWLDNAGGIDPVIKAGVAHFWFVTIHPFEDGNGRIARAIADLALARADACRERFYSMSSQIEAEKKDYYRELESQQRSDVDITSWLTWFLGCLGRALAAADETLSSVLSKARLWDEINKASINDRQRIVINRLVDGFDGPLTTSKYAKLAKCSEDTALRDIQTLVERGILVRNPGAGRSTSYRLARPDEIVG